jgi:hypothetical protein
VCAGASGFRSLQIFAFQHKPEVPRLSIKLEIDMRALFSTCARDLLKDLIKSRAGAVELNSLKYDFKNSLKNGSGAIRTHTKHIEGGEITSLQKSRACALDQPRSHVEL